MPIADTGTRAATRVLAIRRPVALNNPGETMVAHGRGVSLIAGWAEPVENAFGVAAAGLVNAAAVVTRVRLQAFEALRVNEASAARSAPEIRAGREHGQHLAHRGARGGRP